MDNQLLLQYLEDLILKDPEEEHLDESITLLLTEWEKLRDELENLFRHRDQKAALHVMRKGIGLFIQFLYWSNEKQVIVSKLEPLANLEIKPVNVDERIGFIISRPNLYHSYRQLSELITEQEKLYAKQKVVKKRHSQNG
jgi:hypothetical protein